MSSAIFFNDGTAISPRKRIKEEGHGVAVINLEPGQDVCVIQDKDEHKDAGWLMRRVVIGLSGLCGVKYGDFLSAKEFQALVLLLQTGRKIRAGAQLRRASA